jgi:ubiquinone/menaquinone biosynthesis C-methylase UbiE
VIPIGYFIRRSIDELFLEKPHLFLIVLNKKWEKAWEETKLIKNLLEKYSVKQGSHILDLGCGNGRITINLAKMGYRVIGLDYSPTFLEDAIVKVRRHNVDEKVLFIYGDAIDVDEIFNEEVFDTVLIYWTSIIGYSLDPKIDELILSKLYRITKSNGYLMILNHAVLENMDYELLSRKQAILTDLGEYVIVENLHTTL